MKEIHNGRRIERPKKPEWQIAVERAREDAIPLAEAESMDATSGVATAKFLSGAIDGKAYREIIDAHDADIRGQVEFEDSASLQYVLEWYLGNTALAEELARHEEEHYQEAVAHGLSDTSFLIRFFRDEKNAVSFRAAVHIRLPDTMTDEQLRAVLRSIIEAPEDMSDSDVCMVEPPDIEE